VTRAVVRPHNAASLYVGPDDRYVVSLVVAYANDGAASARDAALGALGLFLEGHAPRTHWCVYDRVADRVHLFEQRDLTVEEIDAA
jgi:hypothetical protein